MTATAVITVNKRDNVVLVPNAALRFAPSAKSASGASRGGGLVGMLLPRPPGMNASKIEEPDTKSKEQRVWVLRNGELAALSFTKGLSDGLHTEVASGAVDSSMELVTDEVSASR
jgi:HlyD family secretion protein